MKENETLMGNILWVKTALNFIDLGLKFPVLNVLCMSWFCRMVPAMGCNIMQL